MRFIYFISDFGKINKVSKLNFIYLWKPAERVLRKVTLINFIYYLSKSEVQIK